jgi:predicted CXXCH cytochrome family protein
MTFMKNKRGRIVLIGGLVVWAAAVISCTTAKRTVVAPPEIAGAAYVGSAECATCHDAIAAKFKGATHAKLQVAGDNAKEVGCEACHGPGSVHVQNGGGAFTMIDPDRNPETCFQCHLDKRGEFSLPNSHPVMSGDMTCSACHDPHEGQATPGTGAPLAGLNESCLECHAAQRGPFVFEHEVVARDGCTVCHSPHGSVNAKMLKARNSAVCLQCHAQEVTPSGAIRIGGRDHTYLTPTGRGTCWAGGCHEAVHGSNVNSSLRY